MTLPFTNSLPKPKSDYLASLSTPFGIMQHTSFNLADPHYGYAADDNARALIAANFWRSEKKKYIFQELEERYLKFLKFLQNKDGRFWCYLTFDLKKRDIGLGDWFARTIFALSFLVANSARFDRPALSIIHRSLPILLADPKEISYLRTRAYLILAFYYLFKEHKKTKLFNRRELTQLKINLAGWGKDFQEKFDKNSSAKWAWPETCVSYDNGKLIQAYFLLGELLNRKAYIKIGEKMLKFYLENTLRNGYFQAPGNGYPYNIDAKGTGKEPCSFWRKGKKMPLYDEQPLEVYSLVTALVSAAVITNDHALLNQAKTIYKWFYGKNRLNLSLVEEKSGAVHDGLRKKDLNNNTGAESYLSLNLAYFALKKRVHL